MTKERLQVIAGKRDVAEVIKQIEEVEEYFDKDKDKTLKKLSIVPIIQSKDFILLDRVRTEKFAYDLGFSNYVAECPEYQFIWLQVDKYSKHYNAWMPCIIKMYAKKKAIKIN